MTKQRVHRISAKALVIQSGKILLIRKDDEGGHYYLYPGGGQEHGEPLSQTIEREVYEETGYRVRVDDLAYVRDYIGANHEFRDDQSWFHQVELYFRAVLVSDQPDEPKVLDIGQTGVEWVALDSLSRHRVYPQALTPIVLQVREFPVYLGDVN